MDAIERAIRNAFEKGNAEDRAFREKVYRQAFAALDRAIQAHPTLTVEAAIARRKALQAKIAEIETEFLPAVPAAAPAVEVRAPAGPAAGPTAPAPSVDAPGSARPLAGAPSVEPDLGSVIGAPAGEAASAEPPLPSIDARDRDRMSRDRSSDPASAEVLPDRDDRRAGGRRRSYAAMFLAVTILAAIAIGGWWTYQTGLLLSPEERDTSVPNPPQTLAEEEFTPEEEPAEIPGGPAPVDPDRDWITVFSPADPTLVGAPADAEAAVGQDESGSFMRIRTGASGEPVVFDVGQGILEQIAGKSAVFDIVARSEEGQQTQISVACDFGELGDCGRRRYVVGYERAEYLFEVALPAGEPGAAGSISIDSDFADEGKAVDIYEIRVSVAEQP